MSVDPSNVTANTELGSTKQELIAAAVQKELAHKSVLTAYTTDVSIYCQPGSKTIDFPKASSFTVSNRAEGTKGVPLKLTASLDRLNLDQNAYVSWIIDAMTATQSNIPAQLVSAQRAAAAQARYVDQRLILTARDVVSMFINGSAETAGATYNDLLDMVEAIEMAHVNVGDCAWWVSPTQKKEIFKIPEFKDASKFGVGILPKGAIGELLGAPVLPHSGLQAKDLFLVHREGIVHGFQKGAQYGEQDEIEYGVGAKLAAIDQLFGTSGQQLGELSADAGKSPLVVGLNE